MAQLAQLSKLERQIGIKSSPDKFYGFFRNNMPRFPQMFQSNIKSFEIVGGGELKSGSVTRWKYCLDGSPLMGAKVKLEAIDDARKTMIFDVVEGDVLKMYKSFKAKVEIGADYVKWSLEYEKANNNIPDPDVYLDMAAKLSKGIDAHLSK
ncbi:MLP-like protein 34 [Manihot esculenta]|uniref:Bet v I/Major latex protein domain-containing protein n=1 Tax=Manihot esculenta TaxID=3983 RepID=A0A2C9WEE8_MANES|nr:MLP-like protein 34 [Manihot esculenta]OAY57157.1 hypothetical protein MANES_02G075500v8 [Manihot esculenta]